MGKEKILYTGKDKIKKINNNYFKKKRLNEIC